MKYEEPGLPTHDQAAAVLGRALLADSPDPAAAEALIGLSLADDDQAFVEGWCVRVGREAVSLQLRGTAALCIGHLARRFGQIGPAARQTVSDLAGDPATRSANSQVVDGLEDVRLFAPRA